MAPQACKGRLPERGRQDKSTVDHRWSWWRQWQFKGWFSGGWSVASCCQMLGLSSYCTVVKSCTRSYRIRVYCVEQVFHCLMSRCFLESLGRLPLATRPSIFTVTPPQKPSHHFQAVFLQTMHSAWPGTLTLDEKEVWAGQNTYSTDHFVALVSNKLSLEAAFLEQR